MNPGHMEASFWDSGYSFGLGLVVPGCPKQFVKAVREGCVLDHVATDEQQDQDIREPVEV